LNKANEAIVMNDEDASDRDSYSDSDSDCQNDSQNDISTKRASTSFAFILAFIKQIKIKYEYMLVWYILVGLVFSGHARAPVAMQRLLSGKSHPFPSSSALPATPFLLSGCLGSRHTQINGCHCHKLCSCILNACECLRGTGAVGKG